MLQAATFKFLKDLKKNNNKPWFDEHRKQYDAAKADYATVVDQLIIGIARFDSPIGDLKAKDCTFRINRDVRFSKDKSPYKTNMGASFTAGGKKVNEAGYYFHCEPGESFAVGGVYMPEPADLAKIRQELDYSFAEWEKIITNKTFKKYFPGGIEATSSLSRPPKGYDEHNPAIHFLKMKGLVVSRPFTDTELQDKKTLKEVIKTFEAMKPMIDFFRKAIV